MTVDPRYISPADTARLIRKVLKREFPRTKFSVRTDTYAGGASIRIRWTDGPTQDQVDRHVAGFKGADFDGMIDLKHYASSWLLPDGTARIAHSSGTEGSRGSHPEILQSPMHPDAVEVHFGADFVFLNRDHSPEFLARRAEAAEPNGTAGTCGARQCEACWHHFKADDPVFVARARYSTGHRTVFVCSTDCAAKATAPGVAAAVR